MISAGAKAKQRVPCILVVDDDAGLAGTLRDFLQGEGYTVEVALSAAEALQAQARQPNLALALVDLMMPISDGLAAMEQLHQRDPELPVLIMTGFGTIETAVEAMKRGAEDYLTKPFDREAVRKKVGRLMELHALRGRVAQLEANLQEISDPFAPVIYISGAMQKVVERARAAAASDATILLLGETGTGKEMLARAIHAAGRRASFPFQAVNCGALPRELVESELFGVRKGAFTGAYADAPGVFAAASRGTVFLDEVGEMPKDAQVKLLRVLQERELRPVGSATTVPIDVRVIAATNRPLASLRGQVLREDLYFRLATVVIEIPPLRARREDILVLAQSFAARLSDRYGRHITVSRGAAELLLNDSFPGNVRELENMLESVTALSQEDPQFIGEKDLRPLLSSHTASPAAELGVPLALDDMERVAIERAIRLCEGNRTRAAALLGISRDTLYRKLREFKSPEPGPR
ncbi:MAG TPA: sigma-54 dependent transcriptional regulator [Terriglobales bacterium]|nr:sigma-54 dependent transcriptional regulator [Terriglobales bacterium]